MSFSRVVDRIREGFPEDFGAAEVAADQRSGWIAFKEGVPAGAEDAVANLPGVSLREGHGLSEREIDTSVDLLFHSLLETHGSGFPVTVYPVPRDREIVVEYSPSLIVRFSAEAVEKSMRTAARVIDFGSFSLRSEAVEDGMVAEVLQHGARVLAQACTGAFPVKHKYGPELGIFTAGHCPGTGSYDGIANAFHDPVPYSLSTSPGSGGGDFRWNHSKYGLSGQTFIGHQRQLRVFNTHAYAVVGQFVCKYGKNTDWGCSNVAECGVRSNSRVPDTGQTYPVGGLCRTQQTITVAGDSGGPWYSGTTALGIHHGSAVSGGSAFSQVRNALSMTRVNLVMDASGNTVP
ncbi:S1 family peptidase [Microbacterium resistens]